MIRYFAKSRAAARLFVIIPACFAGLFLHRANAQQHDLSAGTHQAINNLYWFVKDTLLPQPATPFTVGTLRITPAVWEQVRIHIWKGNLDAARQFIMANMPASTGNEALYVAAQSVWVDYLVSTDSFSKAASIAGPLAQFAESAHPANQALAYLALARSSANINENYADAYKNVEKAIAAARASGDKTLEGRAQLLAGMLARKYFYGTSGRSIPYYNRAIEAATAARDTITCIRSLMLKHADLGEGKTPEGRLVFLEQAIRLAAAGNYQKFIPNLCENLFFNLQFAGEHDKATDMLIQAAAYTRRFGMVQLETHMYIQLSEMYSDRKLYDSALHYLDQCTPPETMVPGGKTPDLFKADLFYRMGRYQQAADLYNAGMARYLDAFVIHGQDELNRWETALRMKEKESEIKANTIRRRQLNWIIAGVALVLMVTLAALIRQRSMRRRLAAQNLLISKQSQRLQQSLAEKDLLLKEIHHRVKNNLQVVDSLLNLQQGSIRNGGSEEEAFLKARTQVHTIAMIHQALYQQNDLSAVNMHDFVEALFVQTRTLFRQAAREVVFTNHITGIHLDIDTAVPAGLILNELLTNAFKYAATPAGTLELAVSIAPGADAEHYTMQCRDNGKGLPGGLAAVQGGSLGIELVKQLSRQIGGKLSYSFEDGAIFTIHFLSLKARKEMD